MIIYKEPILQEIRGAVEKSDPNDRIALGDKILTWKEVLKEVEMRTEFGIGFYRAAEESYDAGARL